MKKAYSKPDIIFEDFSLSTSIAAGCEEIPVNSTTNCGVQFGRQTIFLDGIQGCARVVQEDLSEFDRLCYHNPSADYNVFMS